MKRLMQRQGQVGADGAPVRQQPRPRPAARPVKERTTPAEVTRPGPAEPVDQPADIDLPEELPVEQADLLEDPVDQALGAEPDGEVPDGTVLTEDDLLAGAVEEGEEEEEEVVRESPYDRPGSWYVIH